MDCWFACFKGIHSRRSWLWFSLLKMVTHKNWVAHVNVHLSFELPACELRACRSAFFFFFSMHVLLSKSFSDSCDFEGCREEEKQAAFACVEKSTHTDSRLDDEARLQQRRRRGRVVATRSRPVAKDSTKRREKKRKSTRFCFSGRIGSHAKLTQFWGQ